MSYRFVFKSKSLFRAFFRPIHWVSGRSNSGRLSIISKQGKRVVPKFCYIDFTRKFGAGKVIGLFRPSDKNYYSAIIYSDLVGFFFIVAPQNFESGSDIESLSRVFNLGNSMYIQFVPIGYKLYNISSLYSKRAAYARSAGCGSLVVSRESDFSLLKLPSGVLKKFYKNSIVSFGVTSMSFNNQKFKKAGSFFKFGCKPKVRGVAKNPVDHPHGGGEGKKSKPVSPKSPWGWLTVRYSSIRNLFKISRFFKL